MIETNSTKNSSEEKNTLVERKCSTDDWTNRQRHSKRMLLTHEQFFSIREERNHWSRRFREEDKRRNLRDWIVWCHSIHGHFNDRWREMTMNKISEVKNRMNSFNWQKPIFICFFRSFIEISNVWSDYHCKWNGIIFAQWDWSFSNAKNLQNLGQMKCHSNFSLINIKRKSVKEWRKISFHLVKMNNLCQLMKRIEQCSTHFLSDQSKKQVNRMMERKREWTSNSSCPNILMNKNFSIIFRSISLSKHFIDRWRKDSFLFLNN